MAQREGEKTVRSSRLSAYSVPTVNTFPRSTRQPLQLADAGVFTRTAGLQGYMLRLDEEDAKARGRRQRWRHVVAIATAWRHTVTKPPHRSA